MSYIIILLALRLSFECTNTFKIVFLHSNCRLASEIIAWSISNPHNQLFNIAIKIFIINIVTQKS